MAASRCDENIGFMEYMRDKIQDNLNLINLKCSPYLYPYVMMLYNQLILVPGDDDYEEYTGAGFAFLSDITTRLS